MITIRKIFTIFLIISSSFAAVAQPPKIVKRGLAYQMVVDGKPFLMRAGEICNSSASTPEWLRTHVWQTLVDANLNTALVPAYWDLIEPSEGKFDFSLVDSVIDGARRHNLKVVFLWYGAWKNSMSCYAPPWVKMDTQRFPRVEDRKGRQQDMLSPYAHETLNAELNAFVALMTHIKNYDTQHTVIMMQVENEMSMMPMPRDYSKLATQIWKSTVPTVLTNYLKEHKDQLSPHILKYWNGSTFGTWSEDFGDDDYAHEIFTAWSFAAYTNEIAKAGRAAYDIPMYVNCALSRPDCKPGEYPAGGPLPHLMDVWKAGAPRIQMLCPDIYLGDFKTWASAYSKRDNPFFVPEHQYDATAGAKALYTFGECYGLGFSPFAVETMRPDDTPHVLGAAIEVEGQKNGVTIPAAYNIVRCLESEITASCGSKRMRAVLLDSIHSSDTLTIGGYKIIARHDNLLGRTPQSHKPDWNTNAAIIINTSNDKFTVAGTGVVLTFETLEPKKSSAGIIRVEQIATDGSGRVLRVLNGDETDQGRHARIEDGEWGIQMISLYKY